MEATIAKWLAYGVLIEQDDGGFWSWAEIDGESGEALAYSPPFSTFDRVIADLEASFGPLN